MLGRGKNWVLAATIIVMLGAAFFIASAYSIDQGAPGQGMLYKANVASATELKVDGEEKDNCQGCHVMKPEVMTWKMSSHSEVACTACHGSDTMKFEDRQEYTEQVKINQPIPNSSCKNCHSSNRVYSPSGDLIIPHDLHEEQGVQCVQCHNGIAHARIADREVFEDELTTYDNWDEQAAQKVGTLYYRDPSMWTCISCHKSLKITTACAACHDEIPGLPSHEQDRWKRAHGLSARMDIDSCTKCHVTPDKPKFTQHSTGDAATDFARAQNFCYSCHTQRPQFHEDDVLPDHQRFVSERGIKNCLTCHNLNEVRQDENATSTTCNTCHWFEPGALDKIQEELMQ
ncbi:cytochrome c family protein [Metallumcola ferriviriculae]|uniref:Cytochrome c family protein n=1 Tax=Metallumcola ferriviriculae TaxID=3039180 RepID=A0AAU0UQ58_9FIRM|nr:cytochrome c family protein [Desulfitibacteraceae bacterium MK1]